MAIRKKLILTVRTCDVNVSNTPQLAVRHGTLASAKWSWQEDEWMHVCSAHDRDVYRTNTPTNEQDFGQLDTAEVLLREDSWFVANRIKLAKHILGLANRLLPAELAADPNREL